MIEVTPHRIKQETSRHRFVRLGADALVVILVALNWLATQLIASVLHYPPFLTGRLFSFVYQPFAWFFWQYRWPHAAVRVGHYVVSLERCWTLCEHLVFYPVITLLVIGGLISGLLMRMDRTADLHGSAAWGGKADARRSGLL